VLFWNVDGLSASKLHLPDVQERFLQHDLIFLAETWLHPSTKQLPLPPPLAHIFAVQFCNRPWLTGRRNSGGLVALVRKQCSTLRSARWCADSANGILWCTVRRPGSGDLHLAGCYFCPQSSVIYEKYALADPFVVLQRHLAARTRTGDTVLLFGDFNARMGSSDDACLVAQPHITLPSEQPLPLRNTADATVNDFGRELAALLQANHLCALNGRVPGLNTGHTFCRAGGRSLIDWVVGSTQLLTATPQHSVHLDVLPWLPDSPHTMLSFALPATKLPRDWDQASSFLPEWVADLLDGGTPPQRRPACTWNDQMAGQCSNFLQTHCRARLDSLLQQGDIIEASSNFQALLREALQDAQPQQRNAAQHRQSSPFFTAECLGLRRRLKRALRQQQHQQHHRHQQQQHQQQLSGELAVLQHAYTALVRKCKRAWVRERLKKFKTALHEKPREFWRTVRGHDSVRIIGDLPTWHAYIRQLFGAPSPPCTSQHGAERPGGVPDSHALSQPFTLQEVRRAAFVLHNGKAADLAGLRAELIKALLGEEEDKDGTANDETILPHITHVLNLALTSGSMPPSWCKGTVRPIPKVATPTGCDDYRCITLGSILGKLLSTALNVRLNNHLESHGLRTPFQAGFRSGHSPVDQVFVLEHLIDTAKHRKRPLYCTFVDLRKAFDSLRHEHIWDRLRYHGVGGTFLKCVQSLYRNSVVCVDVNGELTDFEHILVGVRQGDPLSPTLFGLCIDTLQTYMEERMLPSDTYKVGGLPAFSLFFADDLALPAATPEALQRALNVLANFCTDWDLQVNLGKTRVVVFNPKPADKHRTWTLAGTVVEAAEQYTYLGLLMHARKGMQRAHMVLADSGRRAHFSMVAICQRLCLKDPSLQQHLFLALVLPVLSYGAELWATFMPIFTDDKYYAKAHAEKVHLSFLRQSTAIPLQTNKRVLTQLAGRLPLGAHWLLRMANFWNRLVAQPADRLVRMAFLDNISLMEAGGACWASRAVGLFQASGIMGSLAAAQTSAPLSNMQLAPLEPIAALNDNFWQQFTVSPRALPSQHVALRTLYTFASWFHHLTFETPVHHNISAQHWRSLLRFCAGGHNLQSTQALRHQKPRAECSCSFCGAPFEDEMHMVVECPAYEELRMGLANFPAQWTDPDKVMRNMFQQQHFKRLAKFVSAALIVRDEYIEAVSVR
jgi:Reverse transcriptase (RNA-dependent DNA polymerase)